MEVSWNAIEVPLKTARCTRKKQFKHRKDPKEYCPKTSQSYIWALVAHAMGNSCPAHGLPMPTWWAADARVTGTSRPTGGHKETNWWTEKVDTLPWLILIILAPLSALFPIFHHYREEIGLKKPMRLQWDFNETSWLKNREVSFLISYYISSI